MTTNNHSRVSTETTIYRMRPGLFKLQVIFCTILALFCLGMFIYLFWRHEKAAFEYFFWLAGFSLWIYAIWYAASARLTTSDTTIQFSAAAQKVNAAWSSVIELKIEAPGPVLIVQETNQASKKSGFGFYNNKKQKIPLHLFMEKWDTAEAWSRDPIGKVILNRADWLFAGQKKN